MNTKKGARELAIDLLERSLCRIQVAAVLSDKHGIFSWGWNYCGPDCKGLHAEDHAISRANRKRLRGARLTVAGRRVQTGRWVCSRPCEKKTKSNRPSCLELARIHGIQTIDFMTKAGTWETLELKYV